MWRQDDGGNQVLMGTSTDRVEALARVLVLESGMPHKQLYWVAGPAEPVVRTNRDLYLRLVDDGEQMKTAGRSLDEFLRAWWRIGRTLADRSALDLDTVAAMIAAAAVVDPPPLSPAWRSTPFDHVDEPSSHADWETIVLSQIADLADFADQGPLDEYAYFGVDAPRPDGCRRATGRRWYNVDPKGYLECGLAGSLGGWDERDGLRTPVSGPVTLLGKEPEPGVRDVATIGWAELAELARCGQEYE